MERVATAPPRASQDVVSVTILIATRNRVDDLRGTLASIFIPRSGALPDWEVLVADNGSTDGTAELCEQFQQRFPERFRWLVEPHKGKSRALNAGLVAARGRVVAMTDDDVICCPDYIEQVHALFSDPSIEAAQGRVFIDWIGGLPVWLDDLSIRLFSLRDHGDELFEWADHLSGCNMIVRREAALAVGGFAAELGPGTVGIAEDSEFSIRLRQRGNRIVYAPHASVRHQVPVARLSRKLMRKRHFGIGRSYAYYVPLKGSFPRFGVHVVKETAKAEIAAQLQRLRKDPATALGRQCGARQRLGFLWQHVLFRLGRRERRLTYLPEAQRSVSV